MADSRPLAMGEDHAKYREGEIRCQQGGPNPYRICNSHTRQIGQSLRAGKPVVVYECLVHGHRFAVWGEGPTPERRRVVDVPTGKIEFGERQ